jgi:putative hydrolase of the HAD superfamily
VSPNAQGPFDARPAAVTFDCWNTLLYEDDWPAAHGRRVAELHRAAAEAGHATTPEEAARAFDAAWARHMELWREERASGAVEIARWALEILGIEPHGIPFDHLVHDWQEASHTSRVEALAGARRLLERLRSLGIRTALICDTGLTPGRVVRRHLDRNGLLEHLELQVFSDEMGVPKPNPRMFRAALEPLRVQPDRSVHVGDLRRTDVAGGRGVGMATVRLRARFDDLEALPEADAVADTHAELAALLGVAD